MILRYYSLVFTVYCGNKFHQKKKEDINVMKEQKELFGSLAFSHTHQKGILKITFSKFWENERYLIEISELSF